MDKIISSLQKQFGETGPEIIKTNLFDCEYFPNAPDRGANVRAWRRRTGHAEGDVIVLLGAILTQNFRYSNLNFISVGHPSGVWSNEKKIEYVSKTTEKIIQRVKH